MMRGRQVGGAVEDQHCATGLQCIDRVAAALNEQDVTSPDANAVQVSVKL